MKTHNKKIFSFSLFVLCGLLILSSCNKKDVEKQIPPDQVAQLAFSINGIEEESDGTPSKFQASLPENNTNSESQLLQLGDMNAEISVSSGPIKTQAAPSNSKQRAANMTNGYKYRVVVVNATTGAVVGSVQATASATGPQAEAAKIDVVKGGTYKWYAYSYNDANDVPVVANQANPVFSPSYDKDLLIAQSTTNVTVPGTAGQGAPVEVQVPITFKHALAKVTVRFDASSRTDQISVLNAALNSSAYFNKGTITLNPLTGSLAYNITGQHSVSAINVSLPNTIVSSSFYTLPSGSAISNFQVNIANLTVGPLTASNKTVNFANTIVPAVGKEVIANINILDVTLIGGVYWATGNLYYDAATQLHKIRNEDTTPRSLSMFGNFLRTDGWNWKATYPYGGQDGNAPSYDPYSTDGVDPCTKVLPVNTWRMPEISEFSPLQTLKNNDSPGNNTYEVYYGAANETSYLRFRTDANSKWIQFNMDGTLLGGAQNTGYFYAKTSNRSYLYITPTQMELETSGIFSTGAGGTFYNIRCVLNR